MSAPPVDDVVAVRGRATPDELAAVLAALAQRPARLADRYEQWRRARIAAAARDLSRRVRQVGRPQGRRLSTDPAAAVPR